MKDDQPCKQVEIAACFSGNTKNFFRFDVGVNQGIKGVIYTPKDNQVPDILLVHLQTRARTEAEKGQGWEIEDRYSG